jgi:hypothetical protein
MKYKDNLLVVNYEDILLNFQSEKERIESYLDQPIADKIPDINDKNLPNFFPNKGIVGAYKDYMDDELINRINSYF